MQIGEEVALGGALEMVDGQRRDDGTQVVWEGGAPVGIEELEGAGFPAAGEWFQRTGGFGQHLIGAIQRKDGGVREAFEDGGGKPARAGRELDDREDVVELGRNQIEERVSQLIASGREDLSLVDEDFRLGFVPGSFSHKDR